MKKSLAFLLCLVMILSSLAGCSDEQETNNLDTSVGDEINIYIGEPIYNFDPAEAYKNETSLKVTSLLFDNLFVLTEKGKVEESLVEDYDYDDDTNKLTLELKQDAYWSDGKQLTANDVMYTWQRLLEPSNSFEAAALLYDIKNAKAVKNGEAILDEETDDPNDTKYVSLDDIGISAINNFELEITFENDVNIDNFLIKLTSPALSPVRKDIVDRTAVPNDWAKSKSTLVTSGPFRVLSINYTEDLTDPADPQYQQIELERNTYYFRNFSEDPINETVYPSKVIIKLKKDTEDFTALYNQGSILYAGDIPLANRAQYKDSATVTDALSTNMLIFNQKAKINNVELFAIAEVRQALSLAINRQEIATAIVFAKPATGIVPNGVFEENSKDDLFRENSTATISENAQQATTLLASKGINPAAYTINLSVPAYDEVQVKIADMVANYWKNIGFNVNVNKIDTVDNADKLVLGNAALPGTKDDVFVEKLGKGEFEVAIIDYVALSADAFSTLAPFAYGYAGTATNQANSPVYTVMPHISGYRSAIFEDKIKSAAAESDSAKRAKFLHEAEAELLKDLPVVPIVFNQNAVLQNETLDDVTFNYYQMPNFTKAVINKD